MTRFKTKIYREAYQIIIDLVCNAAVQMFNISTSNMTGISFQQTKFFKVGVWQPVSSHCLNLSISTKETFNRSWRR